MANYQLKHRKRHALTGELRAKNSGDRIDRRQVVCAQSSEEDRSLQRRCVANSETEKEYALTLSGHHNS